MREIVRLGLRADRERGDPSLGMGLTLEDAKALRKAAGRRVSLASSAGEGAEEREGEGGGRRFSPEEALYVRIQAEVVKEEKVGLVMPGVGGKMRRTGVGGGSTLRDLYRRGGLSFFVTFQNCGILRIKFGRRTIMRGAEPNFIHAHASRCGKKGMISYRDKKAKHGGNLTHLDRESAGGDFLQLFTWRSRKQL